jgi:hypothetical protein
MKNIFGSALVMVLLLSGGCITTTPAVVKPIVAAASNSTRDNYSPEFVAVVFNAAGKGFQDRKYVLADVKILSERTEIVWIGKELPAIRQITFIDDPGTVQLQVDAYVVDAYNNMPLTVVHLPTGNRTSVTPVLYLALHREIERDIYRQIRLLGAPTIGANKT